MSVLTYTTFEDIRGVLGVSDEDVNDVTLNLNIYDFNLQQELEDVSLTSPGATADELSTEFSTVASISEGSRTDDQKRFFRLTQMFATYAVAKQLASSLPLFAPQSVTDSKAGMNRFANNPYADTIKEVEKQYGRSKDRLSAAWGVIQSSTAVAVTSTIIRAVGRGTDRVTNS